MDLQRGSFVSSRQCPRLRILVRPVATDTATILVASVKMWFYMIFYPPRSSPSLSLPLSLYSSSHSREIQLSWCSWYQRRVGVKRAILMHLFMGVIKINARQRARRAAPRSTKRDAIIIAIGMKYYRACH